MDDALSTLLHDVRPRGALFDRSILRPPWSLRLEEDTPLSLLTTLSGSAWVMADGAAPVQMLPQDVVLVLGPYTVADSSSTAPMVVVRDEGVCTTPSGEVVSAALPMCGFEGDLGHSTVVLKGTFQVHGSVSRRVLDALSTVTFIPAVPEGRPTLDMIVREIRLAKPGRQVILDRLLDLLLVSSLREWFDRPDSHAPAWYRAHSDALVGPALRLIHEDPAHPWTVAGLAGAVGSSRATLAQRFSSLVGQSPMAYLTEWRICMAADLLTKTDDTVDAIARQVGYANAYALSVAFKRTMGIRPSEHRATAHAG